MKVTCPSCQKTIENKAIKVKQKKGIHLHKQCPSCGTWFRLQTYFALINTFGLLLLLATSLLNILSIKAAFSLHFSCLGFAGVIAALLSTFYGKQQALKR